MVHMLVSLKGDSGGPLIDKTTSPHTLVGVVSRGSGCARAGNPGIYSRIAKVVSDKKFEIFHSINATN